MCIVVVVWVVRVPVNTDFGAPLLKSQKNLGWRQQTSNRPAISRQKFPTSDCAKAKLPLDNAHSYQRNKHYNYWKTKSQLYQEMKMFSILFLYFPSVLRNCCSAPVRKRKKKKTAPPPVWKSWTLRQNRHKLDIAPLLRWINEGRLWLAGESIDGGYVIPIFQYAWCKNLWKGNTKTI